MRKKRQVVLVLQLWYNKYFLNGPHNTDPLASQIGTLMEPVFIVLSMHCLYLMVHFDQKLILRQSPPEEIMTIPCKGPMRTFLSKPLAKAIWKWILTVTGKVLEVNLFQWFLHIWGLWKRQSRYKHFRMLFYTHSDHNCVNCCRNLSKIYKNTPKFLNFCGEFLNVEGAISTVPNQGFLHTTNRWGRLHVHDVFAPILRTPNRQFILRSCQVCS